MKALSLWQPWASAVALGHKRIETRHWSTSYRGPIAIHAAKRWTAEERAWGDAFADFMPMSSGYPLGAVVATAILSAVEPTRRLVSSIGEREKQLGNYAPGRFGWLLNDIRPLAEPVPARGMQGLFELSDDISALVLAGAAAQ